MVPFLGHVGASFGPGQSMRGRTKIFVRFARDDDLGKLEADMATGTDAFAPILAGFARRVASKHVRTL